MISTPMVPLTLKLEEQGGKGDIKPNGAIYFGIVVRRGNDDIKPNNAIDFCNCRSEGVSVILNPMVPLTLEFE